MIVASRPGSRASIRSSTARELVASSSTPISSSSSSPITQSPSEVPVKVTTRDTSGRSTRRSRSLDTCSSSSAKTTMLPELDRM